MPQISSLFDWFADRPKSSPSIQQQQEREIADGLWTKCQDCNAIAYSKDIIANQMVCLECGHHKRVSCHERIEQLIDADTWSPLDEQLQPTDPLKFKDIKAYSDRIRDTQKKTGLVDAVLTGTGKIEGSPLALGVMDFQFMGGSMGSVVGEKLTRAIEHATKHRPGGDRLCLWWGQNAGRDAQFDANGQDLCRTRTPPRSPIALSAHSDSPDNRWCHC